ncbi:MAG: hypothetical protein JSR66_07310 [Proteobacteria bacterium]|nr:hypothetical protein [Pseudomonadota bacterium]
MQPGAKIEFQGRELLETPDIDAAEVRLANALLTEQCFDQAVALVTEFTQAHPDNYQVLIHTTDENGHSLICSGVMFTNPAMVKAQLSEGADPNGKCCHETLVGYLLLQVASGKFPERQFDERRAKTRGAI